MQQSKIQFKMMSVTDVVLDGHTIEGVVIPRLCHGEKIVNVRSFDDGSEDCDALMTANTTLALGIRTADCAPICFGDGKKIGIAHVGWRGLCLGLIEKMMREFDRDSLEVFVGPRLDSFEIKKDLCYESIYVKFDKQFFSREEDKIFFHFKDAIASCLPKHTIFDERSTGVDVTLPSYRRDKTSKRLLTVVQFKN